MTTTDPSDRSAGGVRRSADLVRASVARARRAARAGGADESGLAGLIELQAVQSAADALVTVALAGSLFFAVPVGEARSQVAVYLLITMAPFAIVAPVVGPVLDRFRHGRRYAMAATLGGRAVMAWIVASALTDDDPLRLYPAAFGVLVLARAYGISRSAAVPRLLPGGTSLVRANARVSLASLLAGLLGATTGALVNGLLGSAWTLRLAGVVFAAAIVLALRLNPEVDSPEGETTLRGREKPVPGPHHVDEDGRPPAGWWATAHDERDRQAPEPTAEPPPPGTPPPATVPAWRRGLGSHVAATLRSAAALRAYSGFLTLFLAFLMRTHPVSDLPDEAALAIVAGAGAGGGVLGTAICNRVTARSPDRLMLTALVATTGTAALGALVSGLVPLAIVALVCGLAWSIGKLAVDATIQREVPEAVRTSAFGRSETVLQLAWVTGGACGTLLPVRSGIGLGLAAAVLALATAAALRDPNHRPGVRASG